MQMDMWILHTVFALKVINTKLVEMREEDKRQ